MVNKIPDHCECPIDKLLLKFIDLHLDLYYNLGFTPNMVTTLGILMGLLTGYEIFHEHYLAAAIFWVIAYYFDCVDGKLARKYNMTSRFGDLYDHFGDAFKYIVVIYALFYSNEKRTTDRQWLYVAILLGLAALLVIHMGYQERIYNNNEESKFLSIYQILVAFDDNPEKTIQYTKYFGCGTWFLCFAFLIIFWCK